MTEQNGQLNNEETKEISIKIGHIGTGKKFILSFYDKKGGKQIQTSPFIQKDKTRDDKGNQDNYYKYGHHFDLREGKDIDRLKKRFTTLKTYKEMTEKHKGLTETSYTEMMIYEFYKLISTGKMDIEGTNKKGEKIKIKIEWNGDKLEKPTPTIQKEKTEKKTTKIDTDGLSF